MRKFQHFEKHGGRLGCIYQSKYALIISETIDLVSSTKIKTNLLYSDNTCYRIEHNNYNDWYIPSITELISIFSTGAVPDVDVLVDSEYFSLVNTISALFISPASVIPVSFKLPYALGSSTVMYSGRYTEVVGVTLGSSYTRCSLHVLDTPLWFLPIRKILVKDL